MSSSPGNDHKNFNSVTYSAAPTSEEGEPMTVFMSGHPNDEKYRSLPQQGPMSTKPPPHLPDFKSLRPPDKSRRSCCQKWALYSCLVGFVFIIASVICAFLMKPFVEDKILENLPLRDGSEAYKGWKDPPVTPVVAFRFFNLTNQEAFLNGRDKPKLVEVGPYVYRQKMEKTDINFMKDEPGVSYKVAKQYYFAKELSCRECSEDDVLILPNIPLFGVFQKLAPESPVAKTIFKGLLESYDFGIDHGPFLKVSVGEYLWGYPSVLASMGRVQALGCGGVNTNRKSESSSWDDFGGLDDDWGDSSDSWRTDGKSRARKQVGTHSKEPNPCEIEENHLTPFGIFVGRNGTGMDVRAVNTGSDRIEDKGLMISWHDKRVLDYWTKPECNVLSGRDPASLPLNIQKTEYLDIFIGQLCRSLTFKYVSEDIISEEFQTYRFTPLENSFDSPEDNPDNECYCVKQPCLKSGLLDIRGCQQFSPIFMSWPHFLFGDADLRRGVHGVHPDKEKHAFVLDIAPKYGIALRALARLQMNVIIEKKSGFGYFDKINADSVVYPFMWLEDGVLGPSEVIVKKVRFLLNLPNNIQNLAVMIGVAIGLLMLVPEIVFWAKSCIGPTPEQDEEKLPEKIKS